MEKTRNLRAVNVSLPANTSAGYHESKIEIPNEYNMITGLALFIQDQPEAIKDFKINVRETNTEHFNLTSKRLFEVNSTVPPKDRFMPQQIPSGNHLDLFLGIELPVAIPANQELNFQVVLEVMSI